MRRDTLFYALVERAEGGFEVLDVTHEVGGRLYARNHRSTSTANEIHRDLSHVAIMAALERVRAAERNGDAAVKAAQDALRKAQAERRKSIRDAARVAA